MPDGVLVALGRMLMWTPGTFFCFPWKPLVCYASGADYRHGLAHFQRDHRHPVNLGIHILCLAIQVGGNFGLLAVLDAKIGLSGDWMAWATTTLWVGTFCTVPAPVSVRVLASLVILLGFVLRHTLATHWELLVPCMVAMQGPCAWYAAIAHYGLRGGAALAFATACGMVVAVCYLAAIPASGSLSTRATELNLAFLGLCAALSQIRINNEPLCETICGALGWAVAVATRDPCMLLLTTSYVGSSLQGVAHEWTGEKPTLTQLSNITDEMAHTTYFPALLVHACHTAVESSGGRQSRRSNVHSK